MNYHPANQPNLERQSILIPNYSEFLSISFTIQSIFSFKMSIFLTDSFYIDLSSKGIFYLLDLLFFIIFKSVRLEFLPIYVGQRAEYFLVSQIWSYYLFMYQIALILRVFGIQFRVVLKKLSFLLAFSIAFALVLVKQNLFSLSESDKQFLVILFGDFWIEFASYRLFCEILYLSLTFIFYFRLSMQSSSYWVWPQRSVLCSILIQFLIQQGTGEQRSRTISTNLMMDWQTGFYLKSSSIKKVINEYF